MKAPSLPSVCARLFPSLGASFASAYYPSRHAVEHGVRGLWRSDDETLRGLRRAPLPALVNRLGGSEVLVYLRDQAGERRAAYVRRERALELLEAGATIELGDIHRRSSSVQSLLADLHGELNILPAPGQRNVFCHATLSPPGEALDWHFDHTEIIVIQLRGKRRWRVAPNGKVPFPQQSFFPTVRDSPRVGPRPAYFPADLAPPRRYRSYVMEPGSVCFLPRGYWHSTSAESTSVSVVLSAGGPSVAQHGLRKLQEVLTLQGRFRRPPVGAPMSRTPPVRASHIIQPPQSVKTTATNQGRKLGPTPLYPMADGMEMAPNPKPTPISTTLAPTRLCNKRASGEAIRSSRTSAWCRATWRTPPRRNRQTPCRSSTPGSNCSSPKLLATPWIWWP